MGFLPISNTGTKGSSNPGREPYRTRLLRAARGVPPMAVAVVCRWGCNGVVRGYLPVQGPQLPLMAHCGGGYALPGVACSSVRGRGWHKAPVRMLQPGAANNVKPVCAVLPIFV